MNSFSTRIIEILQEIPCGRVTTYGTVAALAGNPAGARHVVRILHSCSEKYNLPWHRVVNKKGEIPQRLSMRHLDQIKLLKEERIHFLRNGRIDLEKTMWPSP